MSKVKCRNCGARIPDGAKFCLECGQKLIFMDIQEEFSDYEEYEESSNSSDSDGFYEETDSSEEDVSSSPETTSNNNEGEWDEWDDYPEEESNELSTDNTNSDNDSNNIDDDYEESFDAPDPAPTKKKSAAKAAGTENAKKTAKPVNLAPPKTSKPIGGGFDESASIQAPPKKKKVAKAAKTPETNTSSAPIQEKQESSITEDSKPIKIPKKIESVSTYDPNHDHYYDDVLPDLLNEIEKSPVETILKIVGAVVFLIAIILYCVYFI